jgi:hypothetical protein
MADYITLLGADDVRSASHNMISAAERMQQAASSIQWAFDSHQRFMDDWLQRFQQATEVK